MRKGELKLIYFSLFFRIISPEYRRFRTGLRFVVLLLIVVDLPQELRTVQLLQCINAAGKLIDAVRHALDVELK